MMQRIIGAVAVQAQLDRDIVTDRGPRHETLRATLQRTFIVERHANDAHRSVLYFDVVGVNPTTLEEIVAWSTTREAWQLLLAVFRDVNKNLSADWVSNNVSFDIPFTLENVYGFLKEAEHIVDLKAPNVPDAA